MSPNHPIARRTAVGAGLAAVGTVALAACSKPGSGSAGGTSSVSAGENVAELASIKVGNSAAAKIGDDPVLVYRPSQNDAVCFSAICTHEGCIVHPDGAKLACPCHGSVFDARNGKVLQGPAPQPLPKIEVKIDDGRIVTA